MNTEQTNPIQITAKNFDSEVAESKIPVVLDFWAPWCGPCRAVGPVLEELANQWVGKIKVAKLNVDEEPELAQAFQVRSIPTIVAIKDNNIVDIHIGFGGQQEIEKLFDKLADKEQVN